MKSELRIRDSLGGFAWNQGDDNVRVQDGGDASSTKTRSSKKPLAGARRWIILFGAERQKHLEHGLRSGVSTA